MQFSRCTHSPVPSPGPQCVFAAHITFVHAYCGPLLARARPLLDHKRLMPLHLSVPIKAAFDCAAELLALAARCDKFASLPTGFFVPAGERSQAEKPGQAAAAAAMVCAFWESLHNVSPPAITFALSPT